jgi:hypothetical protein
VNNKLLPEALEGQFFGVGSVNEKDPLKPLEYITKLRVPYTYQLTNFAEEDMIRQIAYLIKGFEEKGEFILDLDMHTYRSITSEETSLLLDENHARSLYQMTKIGKYDYLKTHQTAPASMCFSTRGSDGKQLVSRSMFHFYAALTKRIAKGQYEQLSPHCDTLILSQDDPAIGFVYEMIERGKVEDLSLKYIGNVTNSLYPPDIIPAYHYCYNWINLQEGEWHYLWDSKPKLIHIDVLTFPPIMEEEQAEKVNHFLEEGGGLALGVLPNIDDSYNAPVIETLRHNLKETLEMFKKSGVNLDLLRYNTMLSTQCGLHSAGVELIREIHETSREFPEINDYVYNSMV